jgi:tRNA(fMet)-specific endonuclease VapC
MKYFLDANVLMHLSNDPRKAASIHKHIARVGIENIHVSTITLYELHTKLIKGKVGAANVKKLAEAIELFQVKNFNTSAAITAAKVRAQLEDLGKPSGHADQMLAGHAKFEKAVVVTNNTKDFKHVHGLKIEDWIA